MMADDAPDEEDADGTYMRDVVRPELRLFFLQGCATTPGPRIGPALDRRYTPEQLAQQELNAKQRRIMRAVFGAIILLALILFFWAMFRLAGNPPVFHDEWLELDPM